MPQTDPYLAADIVPRAGDFSASTRLIEKRPEQAKAFRGELVFTEAELARREVRDYEPASVLLECIRAERAALTDGRKSRKTAKSGRVED